MEHNPEVHVIGGGLAGLTAAAIVARSGHPVVVHETKGRLGGRAATDERNGFRFNLGPHALYRNGAAWRTLRELGIRPTGAQPDVSGAMIRDGQRGIAPTGPSALLRTDLLGAREKLEFGRLLTGLRRMDASELATTTVRAWLDDTLGHERVREVVEALVRLGTYANAPDVLSAEVAVQQLQGAVAGVLYLDGGWQQLVDALAATPGVRFEHGPVDTLPDAPAVIVAAGGPANVGRLVGHDYASGAGPAAEAACLDLGIRGTPPADFAIGVDVPRYFSRHSIATGFAPPGHEHVAVAEYLAPDGEPDREGLKEFARLAGVSDEQIVEQRYLHRMTVVTALPTAAGGGMRGRPDVVVPDRDGVFVAGDWVGPEGHLADAVVASARQAALAAVEHLARRPVVR